MLIGIDIEQQAQLFQYPGLEVLRLIDDQYSTFIVGILINEELGKEIVETDLLGFPVIEVEREEQPLQQFTHLLMTAADEPDRDILGNLIQEVTNQGCLATADLSGNHAKACLAWLTRPYSNAV